MNEQIRQVYLDAMGIPSYALRRFDAEGNEPIEELDWDLLESRVKACKKCGLQESRTQTVFGVGDQQADIMFIGEAPGENEDRLGEPFVGRGGQLLNAMLQSVGLSRETIYIANILKCRPPNNRDPKVEEVVHCSSYLERQVELIQPKLIIALGRIAAQTLLGTTTALGKLRGQQYQFKETGIPLLVTYHPAYLLRKPRDKRKAYEDLQMMLSLINH